MKIFFITLLVCLSTVTGCKRKGASQQTVPTAPVSSEVVRAVEELNYALQDFREKHGRLPKDMNELLVIQKISPPKLPPGGRVEISKQFKSVEYIRP